MNWPVLLLIVIPMIAALIVPWFSVGMFLIGISVGAFFCVVLQ